ncbi:MAG: ROK family protein [Verrucomicrobiales bacterium]|nr:ROK family protein [Verrucomicrobiota bacterium JB025]
MSAVLNIPPHPTPELDPEFLPASLWTRSFEALCREHGARPVKIAVLRPKGTGTIHEESLLPAGDPWDALNFRHLERILKALIWLYGGHRFLIAGAPELCPKLQQLYSDSGARAFDADFCRRFFGESPTIEAATDDELRGFDHPATDIDTTAPASGCRIGFDLGGSDRKCAAVIDGEVVFSEEVVWDPYFQKDPDYHLNGIRDSLKLAAAHLPRVDAIGGSAAGVYVDNKVRAASLFRGVPDDLFKDRVENMFLDIAREWGDIPFRIANDGDVTALAGAMSLDDGSVLGLAMGTSTAAGYVDESRNLTDRISELAFLPIDYREHAPVDEWSGDAGCNVQYFSQQAVARLIPASGLPIDSNLGFPEQLEAVQEFMKSGDDRAAAIYRTIGTYLGYAIPHFSRFYQIRHLLLLGRVMSGTGGDIIIEEARKLLRAEFPELAASVRISTPDEKLKRHGQAIAAASLPKIPQAPAIP